MAEDEAGEPGVRSLADKLITDFVIHLDRAEFPGELERQEESMAGSCDATADGVVGIVEEKLGESRDGEAGLSVAVETPFNARIGLPQAKFSRGRGILNAQPGAFVRELDAIANAEIDVEVGDVGDGLIAIEEGHVAKIDFPVEMARSAWIIGVKRRSALGECGGSSNEEAEQEDPDPQHSYGAKEGEQKGYEGIKMNSLRHKSR